MVVADDEPFNLSIVVRMMRQLGCSDIAAVTNGSEALAALDHPKKPSFVILDFNMPGGTGLQVLKLIRTGATTLPRGLAALMLTGNSDFGLVGAAMALDIDAFLIKPVSLEVIAARIERVLPQTQEVKPVAAYEAVDVDAVGQRLLSRKPVGLIRKRADKKTAPAGISVKLELLTVGAILSEDVRSPTGELLLGKATVLNERLIRRLTELQGALNLDYVYIFPPVVEAAG